jgi:PilX N-terminal
MRRLEGEAGAALIVTAGLLFLITLLGLAAFRWSVDEMRIAGNQKASLQARYIAESGIAMLVEWFQEPGAFSESGIVPEGETENGWDHFFARRMTDSRGAPSYFDEKGRSQYSGTMGEPDFRYQPGGESPPLGGESFPDAGTLAELKIFGPTTIGAMATLEATGTTDGRVSRTVQAQLIPSPIPPTLGAVQIGRGSDTALPCLIHWGDLKVLGDARFGDSLAPVPRKNPTAPVVGDAYPSSGREDPWLDFYIGGSILSPPVTSCIGCTEPFLAEGYGHLHQFQVGQQPDFGLDPWEYDRLKRFSRNWGVYFGTDRAGFLYRDGVIDAAHRVTASQALAGLSGGDRRLFMFIDTVDQNPPDGTNLATLELPVDYLEGIFSVQAHVVFRESGPGRPLQVLSPPAEGTNDPASRRSVVIPAVHLKGVLSVAGDLMVAGHPKVFGALITQQRLSGSGQPEIWYDADLRTGYLPGLPAASVLNGSWYIP